MIDHCDGKRSRKSVNEPVSYIFIRRPLYLLHEPSHADVLSDYIGALLSLMALILSASSFVQISRKDKSVSPDFAALAKTAAAAREGNNLAEAIRDYREALKLQPDWQEGLWYVGTLEYERDGYGEAIPAFQRLTQLAPEAGSAWNFLGLCEYETKDYAKALEHLTTGQKLGDTDDPEISRVANITLRCC